MIERKLIMLEQTIDIMRFEDDFNYTFNLEFIV